MADFMGLGAMLAGYDQDWKRTYQKLIITPPNKGRNKMKVKDLIALLKNYDKDLEVNFMASDSRYRGINCISLNSKVVTEKRSEAKTLTEALYATTEQLKTPELEDTTITIDLKQW